MWFQACNDRDQVADHRRIISNILNDSDLEIRQRAVNVLEEMRRRYPKSLDRASVVKVVAKTIVNYEPKGIREVRPADVPRRVAPGVIAIVGTKWTNSILAAIRAFHAVQMRSVEANRLKLDKMVRSSSLFAPENELGRLPKEVFSLKECEISEDRIRIWENRIGLESNGGKYEA
jgi:hypothetical protein